MALKDRKDGLTAPAPVHGAPCSMGQVYRSVLDDAEEIAELQSVLYREGKDASQVWTELVNSGYTVRHSTVNKHRGRRCRCFNIDRDFCPECRSHLAHCECD